MEFAIETRNLSKCFGEIRAVVDVNLKIQKGQIIAMIGPNGAGKSTLIKLLVGLLAPSKGSAEIFGFDIVSQPEETKSSFGYISDDPTAYGYLTGAEFLALTGNLRGIPPAKLKVRIEELKKLFPLGDIIHERMGSYSRGNRQKVAFLAALIAKPKLLIIDEPIVGLDPASIKIFGKSLTEFAENGGTVFFATHILSFAQMHAQRVYLMHDGKIIRDEKITTTTSLEYIYQTIITKT